MPELPFVSVVIPCRNEFKYIAGLLDSIVTQDYPKEKLEIIIADGMSDDGTRNIIKEYSEKYQYIKLIDNEKKIVPTALNKAIKMSIGEIIIRLDAHSIYPNNYFSKLVEVSESTGADNVGAMWETCPGNDTLKAKAIAIAMSHPFGVGGATYRIPTTKTEPFEVDTVPFGCYKRSVFEKIGYYDETMLCNEDNDFNDRLLKSGGKIILIPTLKIKYFARESYTKLWKMFWRYAYFMPYVNKKLSQKTRLSRYIPSIFVASIILPLLLCIKNKKYSYLAYISMLLHFIFSFLFAKQCSGNRFKLIILTVLSFVVSHISYGIGFCAGYVHWVVLNKSSKDEILEINR